jgi:hypothetical protein
MSEAQTGGFFSYDRFLRSFVGLVLAPVAGGAIAMGGYALAAITRGFVTSTLPSDVFGAFINSVTIGIEAGAKLGVPPTLVIGWPLHLILLRTGLVHLATYITFGAALSVVAIQLMLRVVYSASPYAMPVPFEVTLLAAAAGGIGGALFWLIRRPDQDAQPGAS